MEKIKEARQNNVPMTLAEVERSPYRQQYQTAIKKEFDAMFTRGVLKTIDRRLVPMNAEVGNLIVLLTRKGNDVFKSRLV